MRSPAQAFGFLALVAAASASAPPAHAESGEASIDIGGGEVRISYEVGADALPAIPDLSKPQRIRAPYGPLLSTSTPLLWGGIVLPAGEYELAVVVADDLRLSFGIVATSGRFEGLAHAERADYSEPGDRVDYHLMVARRGDAERGVLQMRWRSLLLQGSFAPLVTRLSDAKSWRLSSYRYPEGFPRQAALPIGFLERDGEARRLEHATLVRNLAGDVVLRLEADQYLRDLAQAKALKRRIATLSRHERSEEDPTETQAQIRTLNMRLAFLEKALAERTGSAVQEIGAEVRRREPASRVAEHCARLEPTEASVRLVVESDETVYSFPLPE